MEAITSIWQHWPVNNMSALKNINFGIKRADGYIKKSKHPVNWCAWLWSLMCVWVILHRWCEFHRFCESKLLYTHFFICILYIFTSRYNANFQNFHFYFKMLMYIYTRCGPDGVASLCHLAYCFIAKRSVCVSMLKWKL